MPGTKNEAFPYWTPCMLFYTITISRSHSISIHSTCPKYVFIFLQAKLQLGPNSYGETNIEDNLLKRINDLHRARLEPLVKFLPLILDKLLLLMVKPPTFDGHILNVASINTCTTITQNY